MFNMSLTMLQKKTVYTEEQLSQNVINAIYAVNASGALVDDDTIDLMIKVDSGQLSDDEAILKIMEDENLTF